MKGGRKSILMSILLVFIAMMMVLPVSAATIDIKRLTPDPIYIGDEVEFEATIEYDRTYTKWYELLKNKNHIHWYSVSYDGKDGNQIKNGLPKHITTDEIIKFSNIYTESGTKTVKFDVERSGANGYSVIIKNGEKTEKWYYSGYETVSSEELEFDVIAKRRSGGGSKQHRANIKINESAEFIPLDKLFAGFEDHVVFEIVDSNGVEEILCAYTRGGDIEFPGPIPGPLQTGQCIMDYPYIIDDRHEFTIAEWGRHNGNEIYIRNPGTKVRFNIWKGVDYPSEMTIRVYDKNMIHMVYEETFDVEGQMFDVSFGIQTGLLDDIIGRWD